MWRTVALIPTDVATVAHWYRRLAELVPMSDWVVWEEEAESVWKELDTEAIHAIRTTASPGGECSSIREIEVDGTTAVVHESREMKGLFARVAARIGRVDIIALNDTGADMSVVSAAAAERIGTPLLEAPSVSVWNADGSPFTVRGVLSTRIVFGEGAAMHSLPLKAVVLEELKTDLILGDRWLRETAEEV